MWTPIWRNAKPRKKWAYERMEELPCHRAGPEKVSGAWVFCGTRIPVASLFENLRDGATVDQFLDWFPGVERWQIQTVLYQETRDFKVSIDS